MFSSARNQSTFLMLCLIAPLTMAQESYGVVQFNPNIKDSYQRFQDSMQCRDFADAGGKVEPAPEPASEPTADSGTGKVIAGLLGGGIGAGLFQSISDLIAALPASDSPDLKAKIALFAECLMKRGYTVFPPADQDRFAQSNPLPPNYKREKTPGPYQWMGWELYAKNATNNSELLVQAVDKKLIPDLPAYVKLITQFQLNKAEKFEVTKTAPYAFESFKGYTFESIAAVTEPKIHITHYFLDVGGYVLIIDAISPLESYEQNKAAEKDLPKYFIPTLTTTKTQ